MKKILFLFSFLLILVPGVIRADDFPELPNPPRLVNDFENLLNTQQKQLLEEKLEAYEDSTSNEITIVTLSSLEGYDVGDFANRLFEKWKIGKKGKDNGLLILVSKSERKLWIEVGYGLEGLVTDAFAKQIQEDVIYPELRQGNYYEALDKGTDMLIRKAAGEFKGEPKKKGKGPSFWKVLLIVIIIVFIISRFGGGGGNRYDNYSGRGRRSYGRGGFGPFGGFGGGGFGGGSSGGGFGGFGGGSSGGGGAGGSW